MCFCLDVNMVNCTKLRGKLEKGHRSEEPVPYLGSRNRAYVVILDLEMYLIAPIVEQLASTDKHVFGHHAAATSCAQ
jgi:hypothetical protein